MRKLRSIAREASPRRRLRRRRYPALEYGARGTGKVVLTFDDGPDVDTLAILDVLDGVGVKATFFVLGEQLDRHFDIGREVERRGHDLALHGFRHFRHDRDPEAGAADVQDGFDRLLGAFGSAPRWYRPPFGRFSRESWMRCRELGMTPVHWYASGRDWHDIGARVIARNVSRDLRDGAVVLLHDSARYGDRRSAAATSESIPLIAEDVRARGLEFGALGEAA